MIGKVSAGWHKRQYERALDAERPAEALAAIERAAAADPSDQETVAWHAFALFVNRRYEAARDKLLERQAQLAAHPEPDDWKAHVIGLLGWCHYHLGELTQAREQVALAIEEARKTDLKMHWAGDKYFLGLFLREEGDAQGAAEMFRMVEEDEPSFYYERIQFLFKHVLEAPA